MSCTLCLIPSIIKQLAGRIYFFFSLIAQIQAVCLGFSSQIIQRLLQLQKPRGITCSGDSFRAILKKAAGDRGLLPQGSSLYFPMVLSDF